MLPAGVQRPHSHSGCDSGNGELRKNASLWRHAFVFLGGVAVGMLLFLASVSLWPDHAAVFLQASGPAARRSLQEATPPPRPPRPLHGTHSQHSHVHPSCFGAGAGVDSSSNLPALVVMEQRALVPLDERGHLVVGDHIRRVWIDVGADWASFSSANGKGVHKRRYSRDNERTISAEWWASDDILTIAVDANKEYAAALNKLKNTIAVPCVVDRHEGAAEFLHYEGPGCSSVLPPNEAAAGNNAIPPACKRIKSSQRTCALSLERLLLLIPPRLPVELLKVDAQGVDLSVVRSADSQLHRLRHVVMEAQERSGEGEGGGANLLSRDAELKPAAIAWLTAHGFAYDEELSYEENAAIHEWNLFFHNEDTAAAAAVAA